MSHFREFTQEMHSQIRDLAYFMWESAGRQQGMAMEFWLKAEAELFAAAARAMPFAKAGNEGADATGVPARSESPKPAESPKPTESPKPAESLKPAEAPRDVAAPVTRESNAEAVDRPTVLVEKSTPAALNTRARRTPTRAKVRA